MRRQPRISRNLAPRPVVRRQGDDKKYLVLIRMLPCCVTGERPTEAHHLKRITGEGPTGASMKREDRYAIPLSKASHRAAHAHGNDEEWLASMGVDGRGLADSLWSCYQNKPPGECEARMLAIVERVLDRARLKRAGEPSLQE